MTIDKTKWGDGPWQNEPDRVQWTHRGFLCLLDRHQTWGSWNGYVAVEPGHPWHGRNMSDFVRPQEPIPRVHAGLSWTSISDEFRYYRPPSQTDEEAGFQAAILADPCDYVSQGVYADWLDEHGRGKEAAILRLVPRLWWVGFDCGHGGLDYVPALMGNYPNPVGLDGVPRQLGVYRDVVYASQEVESLARTAWRVMVNSESGSL